MNLYTGAQGMSKERRPGWPSIVAKEAKRGRYRDRERSMLRTMAIWPA